MPFAPVTKSKLKQFAQILDKKFRQSSGLFLIEGAHLFEEYLKSDLRAEWIAVGPSFEEEHPELAGRIRKQFSSITFRAARPEFSKISDTEHAQGIAAAIHRKVQGEMAPGMRPPKQLIVALDRISDPGNLGTILRSVDWFGVKAVFLSASCVEVYNPKVVRATMGSIFRTVCYEGVDLADVLAKLKSQSFTVYGASARGRAIGETPVSARSVLVIGSESHGITEDVRAVCDHAVTIPRYGHGESLNAASACSILLYEFSRSIDRIA